jgi:hypothetical protein
VLRVEPRPGQVEPRLARERRQIVRIVLVRAFAVNRLAALEIYVDRLPALDSFARARSD